MRGCRRARTSDLMIRSPPLRWDTILDRIAHRRQFLHLAAGAAALPTFSRMARAQSYPTRPVHIMVDVAPGGSSDILARLMDQWLSERLGQPFIIDSAGR